MITIYAIITGYILDLIFGDPLWVPHPIRFIGWMISKGEEVLKKIFSNNNRSKFVSGMILTIVVTVSSFIIPYIILYFSYKINTILGYLMESIFCYQIMATKALREESMKVFYELKKENILGARKKLSWIVSRDTENLNAAQVAKGAVETVAENTSDGVVAPMFFLLIGGAPLGFLYKAINTMDSMIGYKNEKYLYFGKFAAKLDDFANYIPARISAYLMIIATVFTRMDSKAAYKIYKRDKANHTSPNSAHTEAVCAGALNIQLAGNNYYFGKLVQKPTIGDFSREIEAEDIKRANKLMYATSILSLIVGSIIRIIIWKGL